MARRTLSTSSLALLAVTGALLAAGLLTVLSPHDPANGQGAPWPAFDLQGHRGARGLAPENTLPAFETALALGVTTLEMDVGMTADGVLVVHHDRRLDPDRTRGADGAWLVGPPPALAALRFADLAAYDIGRLRPGSEAARRFPDQAPGDGARIPALADVLARTEAIAGGAIRYNVEIKTSPIAPDETAAPEALARALVDALRQAGVAGRAIIQSFDWRSLARAQEIAPEIPTAYLTAERPWLDNLERGRPGVSPWTAGRDVDDRDGSVPAMIKAAGGRVWSPYFRDLRTADLREAHRLGLKVVVWTVNDPGDMASLIDFGVDGIITDYPDRLRRVMAGKGLALPTAFGRGAPTPK